ncbi:LTA synthase family protein [Ornithinibacillus halophilus]|uniref:ABC-2 type transport system permease protein n=1 Tax=Ornithinibacillus halophilus TaxID=930117 RepID=A0A1M5IZG2_9BACI|nr:hypothetical protein [Ornithinibacillus halophilus]SHG33694.1 hypothetical protein SAMN05216225_102710 [Ornithinibacillus halophilus]
MISEAFWLAKKEFRHQWIGFVSTILVTILMGILVSGFLLSGAEGQFIQFRIESTLFNHLFLDLIFIGMAPSFAAVFMSKPYLSYREAKDDPHGQRMAVLRSLPIPVSVLALSRTIFMLITLIILSVTFFGTILIFILGISNSFDLMTTGNLIIFLIFWFGYMLALGGMSPYIEFGTGGRIIHVLPYVFLGLFLVGQFTFYKYFGQGIVEKIIVLVEEIGWPIAIISLFVGVMCTIGWNKLLKKRLMNRDYL